MFKKLSFLLTLLITLDLQPNDNPTKRQGLVLTLAKSVDMALQNRPSLKAFKFEIDTQETLAKKALSGYLPQIVGTTSTAYVHHKKGLNENLALELSQLLYSFSGPLDEYKITKKDISIAKYSKESHEHLIRNQVENFFLKTWIIRKKINFIKSLEKASKERFKKETNKKEVDLLNKDEWLKAQAIYAKEDYDVSSYTDQLKSIQKSLEYYVGQKLFYPETKLFWNFRTPVNLENLSTSYKKAFKFRPEIKSKEEEIEKARLQSNFYIKQYLPSLSLKGSAAYNKQTLSPISSYRQIGVQADWNLFDGLSSKHASDASNAQKIKAMMEKEDIVQKIKLEVEQEYYKLTTLLKDLKAKTAAIPFYKNRFLLNKQEFGIGMLSYVELEIAKQDWEKAIFDWLEVRVAVEIKKKDLDFVTGYPK